MTLGNLILTQARLKGYPWDGERLSELTVANTKISQVKEKWKTAWTNKAIREIPARLKLWQDYVDELCGQPRLKVANYPFQVRWRTTLDFLNAEVAGKADTELGRLIEADLRLKKISQPAALVWEVELEPAFPKDRFWYLYVAVQGC